MIMKLLQNCLVVVFLLTIGQTNAAKKGRSSSSKKFFFCFSSASASHLSNRAAFLFSSFCAALTIQQFSLALNELKFELLC